VSVSVSLPTSIFKFRDAIRVMAPRRVFRVSPAASGCEWHSCRRWARVYFDAAIDEPSSLLP
jgi:hypothetical protein